MRLVLFVLTALGLMGLAFWAYRVNYATQATIREVSGLQREITALREAQKLQRAEWAYLNRPERLRDLVNLNFDRVPLLPMESEQFGSIDVVDYPPPPPELPEDLDPIDLDDTSGEEIVLEPRPDYVPNPSEEPL